MTPGEKYSVKMSDEQINSYIETFRMFDKVSWTSVLSRVGLDNVKSLENFWLH